jgi:hypothetical protein
VAFDGLAKRIRVVPYVLGGVRRAGTFVGSGYNSFVGTYCHNSFTMKQSAGQRFT